MGFAVEFAPEAERQAAQVEQWWREHRGGSPTLFERELRTVLTLLAEHPLLGPPFLRAEQPGIRRYLLRRTRYHLYYSFDRAHRMILVRAVWHTARGQDPALT